MRPDDDEFEPRLKAVLRHHVVERCIYAVDLDPLAAELCRLSLWIETMDRTLPFGFLDHKVKCGNALIGAWFDQFRHYPAMAWKNREGGDKGHTNGVHFAREARTRAIKVFVEKKLKPDLKRFLQGRDLFQEDLLENAAAAHGDAMTVLADIHALPVENADARRSLYREKFLGSPEWRSLKGAMDLWCACWFWPAEDIDAAPLPTSFAEPPAGTCAVAERIAAEMRFFHWELEFPDVFRETGAGFDAVLGNPPWETLQPNSLEFFSNIDPLYRSYGKQEALSRQRTKTGRIIYLSIYGLQSPFIWESCRSPPTISAYSGAVRCSLPSYGSRVGRCHERENRCRRQHPRPTAGGRIGSLGRLTCLSVRRALHRHARKRNRPWLPVNLYRLTSTVR